MSGLSPFQRIGYSSGAFTKSLQWNSTEFLLLYFLAEVQGVGAAIAGGILLVSFIWAGVLDVVVARWLDKYSVNYQKVIAYSTPLCVGSFALLFWPVQLYDEQKIPYYLVTIMLFRLGYTLIDIPHNALLGTLSQDSKERTSLSAYRVGFNSFAVLLFAIVSGVILNILDADKSLQQIFMISCISLLFTINLFLSIKPIWHIQHQHKPDDGLNVTVNVYKALLSNRPFLVLIIFTLLAESLLTVFYKSSVYMAGMVLENEQLTTGLLIGLAMGKIIAMPAFSYFMRFLEKQQAIVIACLGHTFCMLVFYVISPESLITMGILFFLCGFFLGALQMLIWAAIPDTIEFGKYYFNVANNALTFGFYHFFMRVSNGISFGLLALVLMIVEQPLGTVAVRSDALVLCTTLLAGLGGMIGILIIRFYPLNHATHQLIMSKI